MDDRSVVTIWGVSCLTVIEGMALVCGMDGVMLTLIVGGICAAIGVALPAEKLKDAVVTRVKG